MKKNYKQKLIETIKISFLLTFLVVEFFGFGFSAAAQAACTYGVAFQEVNNTTAAKPGDTLTFQATATESGSASSCSNQLAVWLGQQTPGGSESVAQQNGSQEYQTVSMNNFTAQATFPYTVPSGISQVSIRAHVTTPSGFLSGGTGLTTSGWVVVNISGVSTGSGGLSVSLTPNQSSFNSGSSVGISVVMSSSLYSQLQSQSVQNVYFNVLVNGDGGFDSTTLPLSAFANQTAAYYGNVDLTTSNGFQNGTNNITVQLWSAGAKVQLGSVTTNIQVLGSTATSGSNSQCSSQGVGYIYNGNACVEATNFSCSASSMTCPTGTTCIVGDGECEQNCTSSTQCVFQGESCNQQGYCTAGGAASNVSSGSGSGTGANNNQCASQGVGYTYNGTTCVAAASFSCSASNTSCPTGTTCIVGDSECEQTCAIGSGSNSCAFQGESCNAQGYCTTGGAASNISAGTGSGTGTSGTTGPAMGNNSGTTLFNPLPEQDLTHVFLLIMQGFMAIIGIFAVVFIVIGGVQMVVSSGNEEMLAKAKKTIIWAILGLVIALMSFSIIAIVEDLLQVNIPAQASPTSMENIVNNKV